MGDHYAVELSSDEPLNQMNELKLFLEIELSLQIERKKNKISFGFPSLNSSTCGAHKLRWWKQKSTDMHLKSKKIFQIWIASVDGDKQSN